MLKGNMEKQMTGFKEMNLISTHLVKTSDLGNGGNLFELLQKTKKLDE